MAQLVFNTNYEGAATVTLVDELIPRLEQVGHTVVRNDWQHYDQYDAAFFMSRDSEIREAQQRNPQLTTVLLDPKLVRGRRNAENAAADLLVATSLEQRDALLHLNESVFVYHSFPEIPERHKTHQARTQTVIGYHGNKEHLVCFAPHINRALERLHRKHPLELHAIYNIRNLGKWRRGQPKGVPVRHIQWTPDIYTDELLAADIGICNNHIPLNPFRHAMTQRLANRLAGIPYPYRSNDTIVRYKYSSNPSRLYVFAQLGIPVVTDFCPSTNQLVRDGESGFVVHSEAGWYWALKQLIEQPELRTRMSTALRSTVSSHFSTANTFQNFNAALRQLLQQKQRA